MNIIYFHSHDTGRLIEPYGHPIPMPNYKKLAQSGILFRQAYAACPTCSPSRSALLTGMTPHANGMMGLTHFDFALTHPERHLAAYLRDQGYETVLSGVQHETDPKTVSTIGYEVDLNPINTQMEATARDLEATRLACEYIQHRDAKKPFFLSLGLFNTHRAGTSFPRNDERIVPPEYVMPPAPLPDLPETREDMARFIESAGVLDRALGELVQSLHDSGEVDDTLIVCTTDHGIAFPGMKGQLYDSGIGVTLIMKFPARFGFPTGKAEDSLVSHLDIYPTLCELIGVPKPAWLQGESIVPLLRGKAAPADKCIFAETNYHVAYEPRRCIRTSRYKLIKSYEPDERHVLCNIDDSPSKDIWMEHGMTARPVPQVQLFDLFLDPLERENLVDQAGYTDIYTNLSKRLEAWMQATSDPLLHGTVPLPPGASTKKRSAVSPSDDEWEVAP